MGGRNLERDAKIFQSRHEQQISQWRVMSVVAYEGLTVLSTLQAKDPSQMSFFFPVHPGVLL